MKIHKKVSFSQGDLEVFRSLGNSLNYIDANGINTDAGCTIDGLLQIKSHLNELAREAGECQILIDSAINLLEGKGNNNGKNR